MSISIVQRLFAFFDNVWSFILTLVRSLLALFSFRRRSSDPLSLPRVNRTPKDALARAHTHLKPILLTQRSITFSPGGYPQRTLSTRSRSATSTLFPGRGENPTASGSGPLPSGPQRTSPKLNSHDAKLGLSVTVAVVGTVVTTSFAEGTPDTSSQTTHTGSLSVVPLTPPDPCFLAPIVPSVTDCPYTESWPANVTNKPRIVGSPLKTSINTEPGFVGPIGSPPPGHWNPIQIWTSTPCKIDDIVPDPAFSPFDHGSQSILDPASVLEDVSHALLSRSRNSIHPYDDTANSSPASDTSLVVNAPSPGTQQQPELIRERHRTQVRPKSQIYPRFHLPDPYACAWRRHGGRVPGKSDRARTHCYSRSYSHVSAPAHEWYGADAYARSPVTALSPPADSATEDEDEVPLGRLRERIVRRSGVVPIGLGFPIGEGCKTVVSPRTRRMSEGCLLALSESTPTRVGVGARCSREALALAADADDGPKDWLEALSLRFEKEKPGSAPEVGREVCEVCVV